MDCGKPGALRDGTNLAWLVLVGSTLVGWWLGHAIQTAQAPMRLATAGVLLIAFAKTWLVGYQFMELKHAPWWLRHGFDAWIIAVCAALMALYLG
ncbi:hypothetical protein BN940_14126 [Castellaniella defragrans 65Phen]|uniref:Uncharacterized protein n=2 Tax=Castellaniella defragrans TaxID=75697 RepID=W8X9R2_CASD6|nr:hypothetical protein BN940_14126 [Castellaniella defragrans 65Phen]